MTKIIKTWILEIWLMSMMVHAYNSSTHAKSEGLESSRTPWLHHETLPEKDVWGWLSEEGRFVEKVLS